MINVQIFLMGLLMVSTLTGLTTEAIKNVLIDLGKTYHANVLAGIVSLVISAAVGVSYVVIAGIGFTSQTVVYLIALVFMSWLCSMVGYDKVMQAIKQFKSTNKE